MSAALVFAILRVGFAVPAFASSVPVAIAAVFLGIPAIWAWRRGEDLGHWGLGFGQVRRTLVITAAVVGVVFPLFLLGYGLFYQAVCAPDAGALRQLAYPGQCARFVGWEALAHPQLPAGIWQELLAQVVVVAIPEELFFRGWMLARLEQVWPPRRRVWGGGIGLGLVVSSACFAIGHVFADGDPLRLAVFFPGLLFGWMRSASGAIAAGVICHALSNLLVAGLHRTFFP